MSVEGDVQQDFATPKTQSYRELKKQHREAMANPPKDDLTQEQQEQVAAIQKFVGKPLKLLEVYRPFTESSGLGPVHEYEIPGMPNAQVVTRIFPDKNNKPTAHTSLNITRSNGTMESHTVGEGHGDSGPNKHTRHTYFPPSSDEPSLDARWSEISPWLSKYEKEKLFTISIVDNVAHTKSGAGQENQRAPDFAWQFHQAMYPPKPAPQHKPPHTASGTPELWT